MYQFLNLNPRQRDVNDCTIRAIALATNRSWDEVYRELSMFAQSLAVMPDDVEYIDDYLLRRFERVCNCRNRNITVGEFVEHNPKGVFLITMKGHITCAIDGVVYDTFDPSNKKIWDAYRV